MTYNEVKDLVKQRAGTKYRGTTLQLFQKLAFGLYPAQDPQIDVEKSEVTKKGATMCGWVGVEERHLRNLLRQIEEVAVIRWADHKITYPMCFDSLLNVEKLADHTKREKREKAAARTARASQARRETKIADKGKALYREGLGLMARAVAPAYELLFSKLASGELGPITPEVQAQIAGCKAARAHSDACGRLAEMWIKTRREKGLAAAEAEMAQYIEDHPEDPAAQVIKAGVAVGKM